LRLRSSRQAGRLAVPGGCGSTVHCEDSGSYPAEAALGRGGVPSWPAASRLPGQNGRMDLGLRDRVYLVTGGSRGLGFAAAQALVADGARVLLSAPHETTAAAATARLSQHAGPRAATLIVNRR
jgi:short chain dehydrogenase